MAKRILDLQATLEIFDSISELEPSDRELLHLAKKAAEKAYAPYSNFQVGAAVLLANGETLCGSNQENIAYPAGQCGESITLFTASNRFPQIPILALAVTTISGAENAEDLVTPCGVCRQVIAEYEIRHQQDIRILMQGKEGKIYLARSNRVLLPLMFEHPEVKRHHG